MNLFFNFENNSHIEISSLSPSQAAANNPSPAQNSPTNEAVTREVAATVFRTLPSANNSFSVQNSSANEATTREVAPTVLETFIDTSSYDPEDPWFWLNHAKQLKANQGIQDPENPAEFRSIDYVALKGLQLWNTQNESLPTDQSQRQLIANAWTIVGSALGSRRQAFVGTKDVSALDCFKNAVEIDPTMAFAWGCLGYHLVKPAVISNKRESRISCLVRAIELVGGDAAEETKSDRAFYWKTLSFYLSNGSVNSVVINGHNYSAADCCLEVIKINPEDPTEKLALGQMLGKSNATVEIDGVQMTALEIYLSILNPTDLSLKQGFRTPDVTLKFWSDFGLLLFNPQIVAKLPQNMRSRLTPAYCFLRGLELKDVVGEHMLLDLADLWGHLAVFLSQQSHLRTVTLKGRKYNAVEAYKKSLELRPDGFAAGLLWSLLARELLKKNEGVVIETREYNALQSAVKGIEVSGEALRPYMILLEVMNAKKLELVVLCNQKNAVLGQQSKKGSLCSKEEIENKIKKLSTPGHFQLAGPGRLDLLPEEERKFNSLSQSCRSSIEEAQRFVRQELLNEERRREEQRAQQLAKNQRRREEELARRGADLDRGFQEAEQESCLNENRERAAACNLQKAQQDHTAANLVVENNDGEPGSWTTVKSATPQKSKKKTGEFQRLLDTYLARPCMVHPRVERWQASALTEAMVRRFRGSTKGYANCESDEIRREVLAHHLPQELERLVGSESFQAKYCKQLEDGTLLMRAFRGHDPVFLFLGVSRGVIYHVGVLPESELPTKLQDILREYSTQQTDFSRDAAEPSSVARGTSSTNAGAGGGASAGDNTANQNIQLVRAATVPERSRVGVPSEEIMIELKEFSLPAMCGAPDNQRFFIAPWPKSTAATTNE